MAIVLLECIHQAIASKAARPLMRSAPLGEAICDVADHAMDEWKKRQGDPRRRRETLEDLAQVFENSLQDTIAQIAAQAGSDMRRPLTAYLGCIPPAIRRAFTRADDPSGQTAPADLVLDEGRDLLPFLPLRAPRFHKGDRPLPGLALELEKLLGVGGFGEVWKARDPRNPSAVAVALKFCLEEDAARVLRHEESVLERVTRQGGHPGLVTLRRAHLDNDPPCLEYEFVEGEDLGRQLRGWADAPQRGLDLMRELADIVAAAHKLDPPVVHRDLKPANILLQQTPRGPQARITDFGIGGLATKQARTQTQTRRSQEAFLLSRLSGAYTPVYASAEQMKGEQPDPRDDVHALGVIWYQLLLGDVNAKPSPDWNLILQEKGVPAEVIAVVGKCLASSKRRLSSAVMLVQELERLLPRPPRAEEAPPPAKKEEPAPAKQPENQAEIERLLRQLPSKEREVCRLYYLEGYSYEEISKEVNVPTATITSILAEVRKRLREEQKNPKEPEKPKESPPAMPPKKEASKSESKVAEEGPVLGAPVFRDNLLTFGCAYGLALQGLEQSWLQVNLRPDEDGWFKKFMKKFRRGTDGVWGIEIGQNALKALRLQLVEDRPTATAFDYVEHVKILSQPDADPDQLIREALEKFLERNVVKGDRVVLGVPSQSGLARFVQLPPVEEKKIADIVKFEASRQIPFPLEEVVWGYQQIVPPEEVVEGLAMRCEIGIFAMKRDVVLRALQFFKDRRVEVEVVQMNSLALCNFLAYDRLGRGIDPLKEADPPCVVGLDIGTDNTNLVITNGAKIIWQRPIPLGGNHFTRAMTKELKLTFAKAEHLKRNATKSGATELKKILEAIKPVLQDFASEVQRSLGYFTNTHRGSRIEYVLGMGNAFLLPGFQRYLQEKLQLDVRKLQTFETLT